MSVARPGESRHQLFFQAPMVPLPLGSELTVMAEECAVLQSDGRMLGGIGPGQHRLTPEAFPFLGSAMLNGAINAEVWFVTTVPWSGLQFGGAIGSLLDAASTIELDARVFGTCSIVVSDSVRFVQGCLGQSMAADAVGQWVGGIVLRRLKDIAAELVMAEGMSPLKLTAPVLQEHLLRGEFAHLEQLGLRFVQLGDLNIIFTEDSLNAYKQWAGAHAADKQQAVVGVGARVLVQWADGNRYPGVVQQLAPGQVLVTFPNGQAQWVPSPFVAPAPS